MVLETVQPLEPLSAIDGPALNKESGLGSLTLAGFMAEVAGRFPEREALCWKDMSGQVRRWTYAEMYAECQKVASALLAAGAGKDARVGVLITNRPEWIFSTFGAAMAGAVTVALNTFSTQQELHYQLQHADIELLIMESGVASKDFVANIQALCPGLGDSAPGEYFHAALPYLRKVVCVDNDKAGDGVQSWDDFLKLGETVSLAIVESTMAALSPMDRGLIFFSSGSTAQPKAIQQTQRAATMQCWRFGRWYGAEKDVRTWSANGFFWSGNFAMAFGSTLSVGGCLVLQRYFEAEEALELFQSEKVSLPIAWPHQEARLTECPGWPEADLSTMTYVDKNLVLASHPTIKSQWHQPNGYGMTETFTFIAGGAAGDIADGSNGPVLPGNTVRIVDPESGAILPLGDTGEIIVKGPTLTSGYLKLPPEELFDAEGFIHTADAGYLDESGHLFWKGRLGDIIKTGGANVSPAEIDAVLVQHPAVQTSFTVGVEHSTLGEMVVACVVLREDQKLDEAGLRSFARELLASYKVPRRVLFFAEADLPMTGSNKIRRPELRKMVAERLVTEEA